MVFFITFFASFVFQRKNISYLRFTIYDVRKREGVAFRGSFCFFLCEHMRPIAAHKIVVLRGHRHGFAVPPRRYGRILQPIHKQMGVFLPVLRTPFNVRLYAAFMPAYTAYKPPIKHRILFYLQKKHPFICVCEKFVVPLPRFSRRVSGDCIRTRMILGFRF